MSTGYIEVPPAPAVASTISGIDAAEQTVVPVLMGLAGLNSAITEHFFHPFSKGLAGWVPVATTAAGSDPLTPTADTVMVDDPYITTTAGVAAISPGWLKNNAGTWSTQIPLNFILDDTTPWACAFRYRVRNTGGFLQMGVGDPAVGAIGGTRAVQVGFINGTSPVFHECTRNNGAGNDTTLSTVAIDGACHTAYVWCDGSGTYKFKIDTESTITLGTTRPFAGIVVQKSAMQINWSVVNNNVFWAAAVWPGTAM